MSFTCPDCLWTSHSARAEEEKYCGHCRDFKSHGLTLTEFQYAASRAIVSRFPLQNLWLAVSFAQERNMRLSSIYIELHALLGASMISQARFDAIKTVINEIAPVMHTILSMPLDPIE